MLPRLAAQGIVPSLIALGVLAPGVGRAAPETYIFQISRVDLAKKDMPAVLDRQVTAELAKAIDAHPDLDGELPAGAPAPDADPTRFKAYLKKRKKRAFKVNVEITDYESAVETRDQRGKVLTVRLALRLFGETVPDRVMAFTGDGSATVKIEIGTTLREKDRSYANEQALELAVRDALATSIKRLREPPPTQPKKR